MPSGAGRVRLGRLRGVGPFSGVLEMRGLEEGAEEAMRRARRHPNVTPCAIHWCSTLDYDISPLLSTIKRHIKSQI
jgi:hypothetical protein